MMEFYKRISQIPCSNKKLCLLLVGMLSLSSVIGCGVPKTDTVSSGTENTSQEPVTLTLGVFENAIVSDFEDNEYTKWLEEQTGFNFEFVIYPEDWAEAKQKLELQIASEQKLPDILMQNRFSEKSIEDYGRAGLFLNLDEYYKKDAVYFDKAMAGCSKEKEEYYRMMIKSSDNHIYRVPIIVESPTNDYSRQAYINKKWLDKLGLDVPETTEELYQVLKAFAGQDPNGNGENDEIPMIGSTGWMEDPYPFLENAFLYCGENTQNPCIVENGKLDVYFTQEAYREALRYMRRLCDENLLSPISFTQDNPQLKAIVNIPDGQPNRVGVFFGYPSLVAPDNTENIMEYEPLPCLTGPENVCYTAYENSSVSGCAFITKYCEYPEAAFRFLDFMFSEEASMRGRYGVKGVDWDAAQEGSLAKYDALGYKALYENLNPSLWGTPGNKVWHMNKTGYLSDVMGMGFSFIESEDPALNHKDRIFVEGFVDRFGKIPGEVVPKLIYTGEEQEELSSFEADLKSYWTESRTRFVVGDMDLDKDWDSYLEKLKGIGLDRYIEINQTAYDRMKE